MTKAPFGQGEYAGMPVLVELARLWDRVQHRAARGGGGPGHTQAELARESGVPAQTVSGWWLGRALPRDAPVVEAVGSVLAAWAGEDPVSIDRWEWLVQASQSARHAEPTYRQGLGRLVTDLTDPFALEVHRPVEVEDLDATGLLALPPYVRRRHDQELAKVVAAAASGESRLAVLVGGSSTGKTRACWEAVTAPGALPVGWRLWHPYDPTRLEALLEHLPDVGPRTVVWLNEAQLYLAAPGDAGERAAAALRTLLEDRSRAPVLVLGTMWDEYWTPLTTGNSTITTLLTGTRIKVPDAFSGTQIDILRGAADPRLAAAAAAVDGQVTQFLAGAPVQLERYQTAKPAARALIEVAMDARRLGHGPALPIILLQTAAPAYMSDAEWDSAGEVWLEQALAYTARSCKGAAGPLTPIRPRPGRRSATESRSAYRLADYLDQHGRRYRAERFPPEEFWDAAATALPSDRYALANAARARGLYRQAAQIAKYAAGSGHGDAGADLVTWLSVIAPDDMRPATYAAVHAGTKDTADSISLLKSLLNVGAVEQAAALAQRVLAEAPLSRPYDVTLLLAALGLAGASEQAAALAQRVLAEAAHMMPFHVTPLLAALGLTGADEQSEALAQRAAAEVSLEDAQDVARLLAVLRQAGAREQVLVLGQRAAAEVSLEDPYDVALLLASLRGTGTDEQVALLARRAVAEVSLHEDFNMVLMLDALEKAGMGEQVTVLAQRAAGVAYESATLLGVLRNVGAGEQAAVLAQRAAAETRLGDGTGVAGLLDALRDMGALEQAAVLAQRAATEVSLDDGARVAALLSALRDAGAGEQAAVVAQRAATEASAADPYHVARLLGALRRAGAGEQAAVLAQRAATEASLVDGARVAALLSALRDAGAGEQVTVLAQRVAMEVCPGDGARVAALLDALRDAGAGEQVTVLAQRAAAEPSFDKAYDVVLLLRALQRVGAGEQAAVLAQRAATKVSLDHADDVALLLGALREAGAAEQAAVLAQRAVTKVSLNDGSHVAGLLDALREVGTGRQMAQFVRRLAAEGLFDQSPDANDARYLFGRNPNGTPARPWSWDDLA